MSVPWRSYKCKLQAGSRSSLTWRGIRLMRVVHVVPRLLSREAYVRRRLSCITRVQSIDTHLQGRWLAQRRPSMTTDARAQDRV